MNLQHLERSHYGSTDFSRIINPEASEDAICNAIHERLAQAHSMTFVMAGEEQDFQRWNDKIQADYYWTLQRMIGEIRRLYDHQTQ